MSYAAAAADKTLFAAPEVVRDLILGFIPDEWLHGLDYRTLERVSGSYVTDDLRDRADDFGSGRCRCDTAGIAWVSSSTLTWRVIP